MVAFFGELEMKIGDVQSHSGSNALPAEKTTQNGSPPYTTMGNRNLFVRKRVLYLELRNQINQVINPNHQSLPLYWA